MDGWHHQMNGHEFEHTPGHGEGQRSLVCCSPRSYKELDITYRLKNNIKQGYVLIDKNVMTRDSK